MPQHRTTLVLLLLLGWLKLWGQYDPAAGQPGSLAIPHNDSRLRQWANFCEVERSWQHWENHNLGQTTAGQDHQATGAPLDGGTVSLGDGGWAVLTFPQAFGDGPGPDLVVFENAFNDGFLELAFVEVSSDGQHFVRFPASFGGDTLQQIGSFSYGQAEHYHNLAGKYRAGYGVGFDLAELQDSLGLDISRITHVRIVDVVGCLACGDTNNRDAQGRKINDPYPTPFDVGGFDLDAVGACYPLGLAQEELASANARPDRTAHNHWALYDVQGRLLQRWQGQALDLQHWPRAWYWLLSEEQGGLWVQP